MYHVVHETRLDFEGFISTRHNKLTTIHHGRSLSWRAYKKISIRLLSAMIILSISSSYVIARTLRFYVPNYFRTCTCLHAWLIHCVTRDAFHQATY